MSIARVLGADKRHDGYVEGNGYQVSWCIGHLVGLCDAGEYDEKYVKWRYEDLPILPDAWKTKVLDSTKKQFGILKKLMNAGTTDEVICATDAGKEGELIFRLVYEKAGCRKPIKRLWISSMEESAIRDGFANMKDGSYYDDLYQSALCRAKADWIVGINASRLFSVLYNKNLKVGRVQTPTLAMIVERNQQVISFKKEAFYEVHLISGEMNAVSRRFATRQEAEIIAAKCQGADAEVVKDNIQKKTVRPPHLYDLTTLQRDANRLFGYTAQQTLSHAQALYEEKLITYPRTDSQYLTDDMEETCQKLGNMICTMTAFGDDIHFPSDVHGLLNSKKVSDHHAILPTMEMGKTDLSSLCKQKRDILLLIAVRVLMAAGAPYIYEAHQCEILCENEIFSLTARHVLQKGWRDIQKRYYEFLGKKQEDEEPELQIKLHDHYDSCDTEVREKFTQPPRQYTEDMLLAAMETAGKEEFEEGAERKGLGTPATRAGIIEKLISSGFVKREKKNLIPTDDGTVLITILPEELRSPYMTAEWENTLTHIANGDSDPEEFLQKITELVRMITNRYQGVSDNASSEFASKNRESLGNCPRCGSDVFEGKKNFYCSNKACSFSLWKNDKFFESVGKELDVKAAKKLLKDGRIHYKDLHSRRTGKSFAAAVILADPGEGYVKFNLQFPQR